MSQDSKNSSQNNWLTKNDFGFIFGGFPDHWHLAITVKDNTEQACQIIRDQILKNQELAQKWLKITENPNWVKGTREFSELYEIVERLKNLKTVYECMVDDKARSEYEEGTLSMLKKVIEDFQKILEGENETN